jgi:thiol-disulfide isomerase/thioredoxin
MGEAMSRKGCKNVPKWLMVSLNVLSILFFSTRLYAGDDLLKNLEIIKAKDKTKPADFTLKDLNGQDVSLSSFEGKVVFLNFWATWCVPCRTEMPSIERLYQEFKNDGLVILAINYREDTDKIKPFLDEVKISFPILLDSEGKTVTEYKIRALPTSYVIDRKGLLVGSALGDRDWANEDAKKLIKKLLK